MIRLDKVSKSYDDGVTLVVKDLSLDVAQGETVALLGSSGCGKTTTLKMINRLIDLSGGTIHVDGRDVMTLNPVQLRRSIGYVFQGIGLFPHMTVGQNVGMVPRLTGWGERDVATRIDELLELVGLPPGEYRDRYPAALSGGQRQRVGVARALAARAKVMLMDEPFGALDPLTRDTLQGEYKRIHRELGLTSVMVTHDMSEALLMADRIAVMSDGRILRVGTPKELVTDPRDDYVKKLLETPKKQSEHFDALVKDAGGPA